MTALPTPYYERDGITVYHSKCESILSQMPDNSVDLIATDPPYFRVKGDWWDRQWNSREGFLEWLGGIADEWRRVLKPNGSLYVFAGPDLCWHVEHLMRERFNVLNTARWVKEEGWHNKTEKEALRSFLSPWESIIFAEQYGDQYEDAARALHKDVFSPLGRYIQSERERAGLSMNDVDVGLGFVRTKNPERGTELCRRWEEGSSLPTKETYERLRALLNERGKKPSEYLRTEYEYLRTEYEELRTEYEELRTEYEELRRPFALTDRAEWSDVWRFKTVPPFESKHPCEKPIALMEHIIRASSRPGDLVLDCFAGSGSTPVAARNLGRRAIAIDATARYCERAMRRLQQSVMQFDEPATRANRLTKVA